MVVGICMITPPLTRPGRPTKLRPGWSTSSMGLSFQRHSRWETSCHLSAVSKHSECQFATGPQRYCVQQLCSQHLKHHVGPGRASGAQSSHPLLSMPQSSRLDFHRLRAAVHCAGGMQAMLPTGLHKSCFGYLR